MAADTVHRSLIDVDDLTDRELFTTVLEALSEPPAAEADSFILHAPLELMARAELLSSVEPGSRNEARRRIAEIAATWATIPPLVPVPDAPSSMSLAEAVRAGDPDAADRALVELAASRQIADIVTDLGGGLLGHLGGAGHLGIFLDQVSRTPRVPRAAILAGRALVRDLARHPDWAIAWIDDDVDPPTSASSFTDVLGAPPSAGPLPTNYIQPTMHLVDESGMAASLLAGPVRSTPVPEARRQLLRIAALSMVLDDPANAPYGWSHCLTMPQAVLAIADRLADPQRAVAVAATYVLGFRATQSGGPIDPDWQPRRPSGTGPLLDADPVDALAIAWHTDHPEHMERELATNAATHHDAHLVKYTLACLHAAKADPAAAPLFRAAAARLAIWWRDEAENPLTEEKTDDR